MDLTALENNKVFMKKILSYLGITFLLLNLSSCLKKEVVCDSGGSEKDCLQKTEKDTDENIPVASDDQEVTPSPVVTPAPVITTPPQITTPVPVTTTPSPTSSDILVLSATSECTEGNDPHYQCGGRWKKFNTLTEDDFIGVCPEAESAEYTDCYGSDKYILLSKLNAADGVLVCAGTGILDEGRSSCTKASYVKEENFSNINSGTTTSTPTTGGGDPIVSSESSILSFTDVTLSTFPDLLPDQSPVPASFEADLGHINNDGCLDAHITSHTSDSADGVYLQKNINGVCQGTFEYLPNDYSASGPSGRRITSWLMIFDLDNDGRNDFIGGDVDGNPSLAAVQGDNNSFTGVTGCLFTVDRCLPFDMDGDGDLELVGAPLVGVNFNDNVLNKPINAAVYNSVYRWPSGEVIWEPNWASLAEPNLTRAWANSMIFDVNNDGYPDMVNPQINLIWFNSPAGLGAGVSGNFTAHATMFDTSYTLDAAKHSNTHQQIFLDFDNDGDMDIFKIRVDKGGNQDIDLADADNDGDGIFLLENNGQGLFTDVSTTVLAGISLKSLTYQTTYAGLGAGDFNNDGLTDIRADWLAGSFTKSCVILMNGGSGNWTRESFECEFVDSSADGRVPSAGGASKTVFAHGDYDDDGRLDLFSSNAQRNINKDTLSLFRNTGDYQNNWVKFLVRGAPTKDGWHSRVTIKVAGTTTILCSREIYLAEQFGSLHEHCGLGKNTAVDIELRLPHGGGTTYFTNITVNKQYVLNAGGIAQEWTPGTGLPGN